MFIQCECGQWEEMSDDEQRWHSQYFQFIKLQGKEAVYTCPNCGGTIYV